MKWRILLQLPSYSQLKQSIIILACMTLHNFIQESALADADFDAVENDENFMVASESSSAEESVLNNHLGDEDQDMNAFRDSIANNLVRYVVLYFILALVCYCCLSRVLLLCWKTN